MSTAVKAEPAVLGVVLVALGVLWTLSNVTGLDLLRTLRTWWPSTLVLWGAVELYNSAAARRRSKP